MMELNLYSIEYGVNWRKDSRANVRAVNEHQALTKFRILYGEKAYRNVFSISKVVNDKRNHLYQEYETDWRYHSYFMGLEFDIRDYGEKDGRRRFHSAAAVC